MYQAEKQSLLFFMTNHFFNTWGTFAVYFLVFPKSPSTGKPDLMVNIPVINFLNSDILDSNR